MLYIDLFLVNKHARSIRVREACLWWLLWVVLALVFGIGVYIYMSPEKGLQFFTGYLIEQSLSVDNMFVFIMIFAYFRIDSLHQPRVLKWGILGAVLMRFVMILLGTALVRAFHWILYLFGAFLVYAGVKMALGEEKQLDPEKNPVYRVLKKFVPLTGFHGSAFFARVGGLYHATTLFLALVILEFSDLVFALDSIPAIFAITTDTFVVYTSNIFAILGLRALFFLLSGAVQLFAYLKYGVALILAFVGVKMVLADFFPISTLISLLVIMSVLTLSIIASVLLKPEGSEIGTRKEK